MDYYSILEVPRDATMEQIRSSYHRLALRYHPDKAGPEGAERFKEIQEAYELLSSPEKRRMYDMYGNVAGDELSWMFAGERPFLVMLVWLSLVLLIVILCIIFTAFLAAYVDGSLRSRDVSTVDDDSRAYWNYVKVFSPLFVIDVLIGIPALWIFFFSICTCSVTMFLNLAVVLCCIILSVFIPVVKDRNDMKTLRGETDFLLWHVWLIPLYVAVILFAIRCILSFPTKRMYALLVSRQMEWLWKCIKVRYVFSILRCLPMMVFCALIACRADDVITTNYFVVVGMPFFVWAFLLLVDVIICKVLLRRHKESLSNLTFVLSMVMLLLLISVGLVSKRLNDVSRVSNGGGGDVLSLAHALIPVYVCLGFLFIATLVIVLHLIALLFLYTCVGTDSPSNDTPEGANAQTNSDAREDGEGTQNGIHNVSHGDDVAALQGLSDNEAMFSSWGNNNVANSESVEGKQEERSDRHPREGGAHPTPLRHHLSDID